MGRFILKIKKILQISSDLTPADLGENELTINIKTEPWKTHIAYVTKKSFGSRLWRKVSLLKNIQRFLQKKLLSENTIFIINPDVLQQFYNISFKDSTVWSSCY